MSFVFGLEGNLKANKGYASKRYFLKSFISYELPHRGTETSYFIQRVQICLNLLAHYCTW